MDSLSGGELQEGVQIGLGGADFMPIRPVKDNAAGASLLNDFQPDGEDGKFIIIREHRSNFRLHDVSACKLVCAGVDVESMPHVRDVAGGGVEPNIAIAVHTAQSHSQQIS